MGEAEDDKTVGISYVGISSFYRSVVRGCQLFAESVKFPFSFVSQPAIVFSFLIALFFIEMQLFAFNVIQICICAGAVA